jgi:hypothetical protein
MLHYITLGPAHEPWHRNRRRCRGFLAICVRMLVQKKRIEIVFEGDFRCRPAKAGG